MCEMKWVILAGFLVFLVGFGEGNVPKKSELPQGKECAAGSRWTSRCNSCQCSQDGFRSCDSAVCDGQEDVPEMRCAPNTKWMNDCNTCSCTSNGRAMCTKIGCDSIITNQGPGNHNSEKEITGPCTPSTSSIGPEIQSKIFEYLKVYTDKVELIEHNLVKRSVCKANEEFESECNSCKCSGDGQRYTCTQNECLERDMTKEVEVFMESEGVDHIERHSVCEPSVIFYIGCNTCHCNIDGTDYSCTNKPCPLPDDVEIVPELKITKSSKNDTKEVVCVANRMFIKDCNTCWCNDDGTSYICTRKVCVPDLPDEPSIDEEKPEELRIIKRQCRPDEVFELDCNMCRCNPDGKSFSCTRRACVEEDIKNTTPRVLRRLARATPKQKVCDPGQEFRFDCNKCLCSNDGFEFSCTRFDCYNGESAGTRRKRAISEVKEISTNCTNGTVFEVECNTCRCNADGRATCTNKPCNQELKKNDQNSDVTESDPGFRCNPGEQFKKNCNDCTCSADGRSFFCTVRLCEQGITPGITP